ncbi:hypothetical protein EV360DRAFT_9258, partial [Lentinula raphanica]
MTAHKSQGSTFDNIVVDISSCTGTERPYVMMSRVKSINGLVILRSFPKSKISCRQSQDVRVESQRLQILHDFT